MAVVTTLIEDEGVVRTWAVPGDAFIRGIPRGEVIYHGQNAVAAKAAADSSVYALSLALPPNFAYRLVDLQLVVQAEASAVFDDWQTGAEYELVTLGVTNRVGVIYAVNTPGGSGGEEFIWIDDSVTRNIMILMDTSQGVLLDDLFVAPPAPAGSPLAVPHLFLRYNDDSPDTTTAISVIHHARFFQYTVEQFNSWQANLQIPVIP